MINAPRFEDLGAAVGTETDEAMTDEAPARSVSSVVPDIITVDELAVFLRVERKTAYAAIAAGEVPGARRIGRAIRIHAPTVLAWLAEGQGRASRSRRK